MNKTAIRNFAIWARNKLIADVSYHAGLMGITKNGVAQALPQSTKDVEFFDIGTSEPYVVRGEAIQQRKSLVSVIRQKEKDSNYETAYSSLMEEVAYTWFNRLIAMRFMEVNDYLPAHIRVLSSESGKQEPDIVTNPFDADLFFVEGENQKIIQMKNDNKLDEVFRILFIKQCRELSKILPRLFEGTNDYTELLLNLSFIDQDGVIYHLIHDIPEDDFNVEKGGQVEIIGWLYQYYNAELKDETFALLKNNVKVTKERVPSATQLFTPDWIVRYMVENSLGRLWVEGHPNDLLKSGWKYYLDEAEQEESVKEELEKIRSEYAKLNPEDIKIIDPCMGSGHILVYAFDVLMQIYESAGYTQRDAAKSILEHNLFGLDIDDRAAQLAYFAVMMKARQYNRRILDGETNCNVYAIKESNNFDREALVKLGDDLRPVAERLIDAFVDAKEYGSIITVDVTLDELDALEKRLDDVDRMSEYGNLLDIMYAGILCTELGAIIKQARVMRQLYDVVITNPPYMGGANMSPKLQAFCQSEYPSSKMDLYSVFVEKILTMMHLNGLTGLMTSYTWMFLTSFEKFRDNLLENTGIMSLVQPEYHAFFESANVPICTFVLRKGELNYRGIYVNLKKFAGAESQAPRFLEAIREPKCNYRYSASQSQYSQIPGKPIAYWIKESIIDMFRNGSLMGAYAELKQGLITGDNDRFTRLWQECDRNKVYIGTNQRKWYFYHKGGEYRKWYGNIFLVVNWEDNGKEIIEFRDDKGKQKSRPQNIQYYLQEGFTWTSLTISDFNVRYMPEGAVFAAKGSAGFPTDNKNLNYIIGLCNSKVAMEFLSFLAPTMDYNNGSVAKMPTILDEEQRVWVNSIVEENVALSKEDWDSFETSWDFKKHSLI